MANVDNIGALVVPKPQQRAKPEGEKKKIEFPLVKPPSSELRGVAPRTSQKEAPAPPKRLTPQELMKMLNRVDLYYDLFEVQANFSIDPATGGVQIKVVNNKTGEVIRKIPPYEACKLLMERAKAAGSSVDQKV